MKYVIAVFLLVFMSSCQKDEGDNVIIDYTEQNENEILDYLNENNLEAQKTNSGLYYIVLEEGEGDPPTSKSDVRVKYKGYFTNGNIFQQSDDEGITFNLQEVIAGWTEGITFFNEGSKGILIIPSRLAYGSLNYSGIPGGSVLIFEIELLEVKA